jgi:hypothetical protein
MRGYECYVYHLENNKLVQNSNTACWNGLNTSKYRKYDKNQKQCVNIILDEATKDYIYIDKYIEPEITDKQRKRMVYLLNKITPCKFEKIEDITYIKFRLLNNHYSNLLLLNFIRILWYENSSFDNKQFFTDICKRKPQDLDYLEFMMTCIKNNVSTQGQSSWNYGDHSFVYLGIIPKTKEMLLKYTGNSMYNFLQCKIKDIK